MDVEYWEIIDTGSKSAQENMLFDAQLLEKAHCYKRPVLHFYEWEKPSATYGHFIQPAAVFDLARVEEKGLCLVQRPTRGGDYFPYMGYGFFSTCSNDSKCIYSCKTFSSEYACRSYSPGNFLFSG